MELYHKTSPHRIEAIRLFNIIQEHSPNPHQTINAESILHFMRALHMSDNTQVIKLIHQIDKEGKEMNDEYWSICISRAFSSVKVDSPMDLRAFHSFFKNKLLSHMFEPLLRYEEWDDNRTKGQEARSATYAEIIQYWDEVKLYIHNTNTLMIHENIAQINRCFSLCTLYPDKTSSILSVYEQILKGSFLQALQYLLTMSIEDNLLVEILKTLCYLFQGLKYEKIRILLEQTFLLGADTMKGLAKNIEDMRVEVRYYSCVMANLMMNRVSTFPPIILEDQGLFRSICSAIATMKEEEGLYYGLQFMTATVCRFGERGTNWQKENSAIVSDIFKFAIMCLQNSKDTETHVACLHLLAECLKIDALSNQEMKQLHVVTKVFDYSDDEFLQPLIVGTLEIVKNSLCFGRVEAEESIFNDKNFENYIRKVLEIEHKPWQPILSLLQICHILGSSKNSKFLFEKDLVMVIFKMSMPQEGNSNNGSIMLYLSEIMLMLIQHSLQSQWKMTYLYEKGLLQTIGNLLTASFTNDEIVYQNYQYIYPNQEKTPNMFIHKKLFVNSHKMLYLLSSNLTTGVSYDKKRELYIKSFSKNYLLQFWDAIKYYFFVPMNEKFIAFNLKEEHKMTLPEHQQEIRMRTCKLISSVIEEITYCLRKRNTVRDPTLLKAVHEMRHEVYELFYKFLTFEELESNHIPIYFKLLTHIEGEGGMAKNRFHRLGWLQFQSCITDIVRRKKEFEPGDYKIAEKMSNYEIRGELDYQKIMEKIFQDYKNSQFTVEIFVSSVNPKVEIRPHHENRPLPMFGGGNEPNRREQPETYQSYRERERNEYRPEAPRFMSSRMPENRGTSPISYRMNQPTMSILFRQNSQPFSNLQSMHYQEMILQAN